MEQEISRKEYKRFLIRAAREAECGLPVHYPDIAEIDSLIEDPAFSEVKFRKDVLFYFSAAMVYGFFRDKKWHELHPGRENMSVANLMEYLMTPMEGCLELHVGIWSEKADEQEKEDRQAAFEYMQSLITDQSLFQITKPERKKAASR